MFAFAKVFMSDSSVRNICSRIRQLRIEYAGARGKAQFARQLDISASTYDYYEKSRIPPAPLLVSIADLTGADLRWLLTGQSSAGPLAPAGHPAVARAAELLEAHPNAAEPLAAFVDLLAETYMFPAKFAETAGKPGNASAPPPDGQALAAPGEAVASSRGWIPILGRSAAGVAHFWPESAGEVRATTLEDILGPLRPESMHTQSARAAGSALPAPAVVQLVTLDEPIPPGTAEWVVAEHLAASLSRPFAVRIDGDSMSPEIRHGDLVVLSADRSAESGAPAVVQLEGQIGVTCKIYTLDGDDVHLAPINEQYPPQRFSGERVRWALKVLARIRPS